MATGLLVSAFRRSNAVLNGTRLLQQCPKTCGQVNRRTYCSRSSGKFSTAIEEFENEPGIDTHADLHAFSLRNPDEFWGRLARSRLRWFKDFDTVQDCDMAKGKIAWFLNGKINVSVNCVDRHYEKHPDRVALIWEKDEPANQQNVTYRELYQMMNQLANTLKSHGTRKGDRVIIYMPVFPLAVAAMMACARIGAPHSVVFAGFSAEALASRIQDTGANTVITADQGVRGGKLVELKRTVDKAVEQCPCVERLLVAQRTGAEVPMGALDIPLEQEMAKQSTECTPEIMDSEEFLFLLYTSGSTGKPKGVAHTQAGYILYAMLTQKFVFDYQDGDIFACVADIGWITGHSYVVYGPLANGATTVLFESVPTYPDPGRYWEMVERLRVNQFYGAPTALRQLLRYDDSWVKKYDRSSLKTLGCVGEPLNREAWDWYYQVVGDRRCPIADTWWQTETGGISITPRPSSPDAEIRPGMPMRPFFGIQPVLCGQKGEVLRGSNMEGALCIAKPWPGLMRTVWGDHQRYLDTYFNPYPGYYFSGDGAMRTDDGFYRITGRMDDVLNVSGHRLGTAEIEDVMDEHPLVSETAVVGYPHEIRGEGVYAFVTLKEEVDKSNDVIIAELKAMVRNKIAAFAVPELVQIASGLPKTRSGKIMRRVLRKVAANQSNDLGDISTLADPSVVENIVSNHAEIIRQSSTH